MREPPTNEKTARGASPRAAQKKKVSRQRDFQQYWWQQGQLCAIPFLVGLHSSEMKRVRQLRQVKVIAGLEEMILTMGGATSFLFLG